MRLIATVVVLVLVLWLGMKAFTATTSSGTAASSPQGVVGQARRDLNRGEAQGQQQLQQSLTQVGRQP